MRDIDTDPPCTLTNIVFVLWRAQEVFFFFCIRRHANPTPQNEFKINIFLLTQNKSTVSKITNKTTTKHLINRYKIKIFHQQTIIYTIL